MLLREGVEKVSKLKHPPLYIVVLIDEMADFDPKIAGEEGFINKKIRAILAKISRLGRKFGIKSIVATQKPTYDDIPTQVRANMLERIAFGITEKRDSKVILSVDNGGAEKII
ncbi:MAG: hypothetical protein AAF770_01020 [Bacteroidota bacterium]